ncbi:MAG: hypothetical protein K9W43_10335 [Candidatus Thorarchaeota archaeon]|nr:hypothetical protein [Candidatus Thorarchaeota archaeon]
MKIECELCGGEDWLATIYEIRVAGMPVVYSALKCKACGAIYPLAELGKQVSKERIKSYLK